MKLKHLQSQLEDVQPFEKAKFALEQYPTTPHLAAHMLTFIDTEYDDIEDQVVCDLGVGCGMLSIGASILGAGACIGVDIDPDALEIAKHNLTRFEVEADLVLCDLGTSSPFANRPVADVVLMNPPFGTKNAGIDTKFLTHAVSIARKAVYSLHKSSTREHIVKTAERLGATCEVLAELKFNIGKTMAMHKQKNVDVYVDLVRLDVSAMNNAREGEQGDNHES
eukprot:TRINITY_DN37279_c0_g1_i1.p1 TRINITY_DN37279_c0_g1~~TRINITY_DN37279_c0_g1_i1.p1  ORF type:complete len:223 (-),score=29.26 TRINITY_DN37279_c0_g1_i1:6-674(-)